MISTAIRRVGVSIVVAIVTLVAPATAAGAVQQAPTDWHSTVISVEPTTPVLHLEVLGEGTAIRVSIDEGHTLVVPGYQNEPYLRIGADGTVEVNRRSPADLLNRTDTGAGMSTSVGDPSAEPDWQRIGGTGSVLWHDHRMHAMPGVSEDTDWTITFLVDGRPVVARGRLTRLPGHVPALELLAGLAAMGVMVLLGLHRPLRIASLAATGAAAIATAVSVGTWFRTPDGLAHPWAPLLVAVTALGLAILVIAPGRPRGRTRLVLLLGSVALSAGWVVLELPALTAAIVPGPWGSGPTRFALTIAGGLVLAAAGLAVLSGGFMIEPTDRALPQAEVASGGCTTSGSRSDGVAVP